MTDTPGADGEAQSDLREGPREDVNSETRASTGQTDLVGPPSSRPDAADDDAILGELLDDLPEDKRTLVSVAISARSHRGPLPDPETLAAYKAIDSRLVDEVIEAASENRKHRYIMDRKLADTARYSLIFSAALVLAALIAAVILAIVGHPVVGGILGGGGLGAIVFTLIRGGGIWSGRGPQKELDRGTATRPTMPS